MSFKNKHIENQLITLAGLEKFGVSLYIKREDRIHAYISGNKYRKLKYNILYAQEEKKDTLLTFGGAYSNHISAVAFVGKEFGFKTIGIIRGEELKKDLKFTLEHNLTLQRAFKNGMQFEFISRSDYRFKNDSIFIEKLKEKYDNFYLIPEGGTNELAIKGCEEILKNEDDRFNFVCCPVGTGGTISGLINSASNDQKILGFPALKGNFLCKEIEKYTNHKMNWELINDYNFGGYAKIDKELVNFINNFKKETAIPLDPIYTGKMIFGLVDLIKKGYFKKGTKILAIHTGGLQGISGMNVKLKQKKLPIIE